MLIKFILTPLTTKFFSWFGNLGYQAAHNEELEVDENECKKDGFKSAYGAGEITILSHEDDELSPVLQREVLKFYSAGRQADCSVAIPDNTAAKGYVLVSTTGTGVSLGDLLYDNGKTDGKAMSVEASIPKLIYASAALAGGTLEFEATTLYYIENDYTVTKIANIGSATSIDGSAAAVRDLLQTLVGADRFSLDYAKDGATNAAYTLVEQAKLGLVEASATADQSAGEIMGLLAGLTGANQLPINVIKDAGTKVCMLLTERTKLGLIEASATADQTAAEIRDALETLAGANRLDGDKVKDGTTNLYFTAAERARLVAMEDAATADQTGLEIVNLLEALGAPDKLDADGIIDGVTNGVYTLAERARLAAMEDAATADQTGLEIVNLLEALGAPDKLDADGIIDGATNGVYTLTERAKLATVGLNGVYEEATALTGAGTKVTTMEFPVNGIIESCKWIVVDTITGDGGALTVAAAFSSGSTTVIAASIASAINDKGHITYAGDPITSTTAKITYTASAGNFTGGIIKAQVVVRLAPDNYPNA